MLNSSEVRLRRRLEKLRRLILRAEQTSSPHGPLRAWLGEVGESTLTAVQLLEARRPFWHCTAHDVRPDKLSALPLLDNGPGGDPWILPRSLSHDDKKRVRHGQRPCDPMFAWFMGDPMQCVKHVRSREEQPHDGSPRGKAYTLIGILPEHDHYCTLKSNGAAGPPGSLVTALGVRLGPDDKWVALKFMADLTCFAFHKPRQPVVYGFLRTPP